MSIRRSVRQGIREGWNDMFEPSVVLGRAIVVALAGVARRVRRALGRET